MSWTLDTKNASSYTPQDKNTSSYTNQTKVNIGDITWASVLTTWATETRTWANMNIGGYVNQTKS